MVKVKICGITNWTDARHAVESGADFLGFNFYRGSSRYIAPAKARRIIEKLPNRILAVGVFVNANEEEIREIARSVGLDQLQLHGLVRSKHCPGGNAKQQGVSDLTGGAGYSYFNRVVHDLLG